MIVSKLEALFEGNATINHKYGKMWNINCRLGLWGVSCHDIGTAMREAMHYYQQYKGDGEYENGDSK